MIPLDELRTVAALREIDPGDLAELSRQGALRLAAAGEPLFEQGVPAASFFLVIDGWTKVSQLDPDGKQILVRLVGPGEFCGLAVLLDREDYPGTARALVPVRAAAWPIGVWRRLFQANAGLASGVLGVLGRHISESHLRIAELSTEAAERRLARTVLRLARRAGVAAPEGLAIAFPVTRQDLAELSGTTLHNASRILSAWTANGMVGGGRRRLLVRDMAALQDIAGAAEP